MATQLPSGPGLQVGYVIPAANLAALQALNTGSLVSGVLGVAQDTNNTYQWTGTSWFLKESGGNVLTKSSLVPINLALITAGLKVTSPQTSATQTNPGYHSGYIYVNVTVLPSTGTLDLKFNAIDALSGVSFPFFSITQITAIGAYLFFIGDTFAPSPGSAWSGPLPDSWNVVGTLNAAAQVAPGTNYSVAAGEVS